MKNKVLIVEDSIMMRALISRILSTEPDINVVGEASCGEDALEIMEEVNPDVILLDIELPGMDGIEFLKRIRLISTAKVIVVSSVARPGSPQSEMITELGAYNIISKPTGALSFDFEKNKSSELICSIRNALN